MYVKKIIEKLKIQHFLNFENLINRINHVHTFLELYVMVCSSAEIMQKIAEKQDGGGKFILCFFFVLHSFNCKFCRDR